MSKRLFLILFRINGSHCIVKCSGWDYKYPPEHGTVLTVGHTGLFKNSGKMKYPFLFKIRPELCWTEIIEDKKMESE